MNFNYILNQISSDDIIFCQRHGQVKSYLFSNKRKIIRMKICSTVFLAIPITITLLTNRCSTKNSLLW